MQSVEERLDSINENVIAIPFGGSEDEAGSDEEYYYNAKEALELSIPSNSKADDDEGSMEGRRRKKTRQPSSSVASLHCFPARMFTQPELAHRDLPGGPFLRMAAYEHSWGRISYRIMETLREIRTEVTDRVVSAVKEAYVPKEEDRLMPFMELRTLTVSGSDRGSTAALLAGVKDTLAQPVLDDRNLDDDDDAKDAENRGEALARISTVEASDCMSITSTMRALIGGFLRGDDDAADVDENSNDRSWRLAPYDINLLVNWYKNLQMRRVGREPQKLVVLIPELEKVDPSIMQDVFYICSIHVHDLPLVFVLGLSSPPQQSYLHSAYPRSTRALLHVTRFEAPAGPEILERVLVDTFFDPEFEPDVMPSGMALSFMHEQFSRMAQSMDFVMSLLQLLLLRHFAEPLTVLTVNHLLGQSTEGEAAQVLEQPEAKAFLVTLYARLKSVQSKTSQVGNAGAASSSADYAAGSSSDDEMLIASSSTPSRLSQAGRRSNGNGSTGENISLTSPSSLIRNLKAIRSSHRRRAHRLRLASRLIYTLRTHLFRAGVLRPTVSDRLSRHRSTEEVEIEERIGMMCAILRGRLGEKEGRRLCEGVNKLDLGAVDELLGSMMPLVKSAGDSLKGAARATFETQMEGWITRLREQAIADGQDEDDVSVEVLGEVAEWAVTFAMDHIYDVTEGKLWDLWVTASPSSVIDLFNPSPRAAIMNALVHPERYLNSVTSAAPPSSTTPTASPRATASSPDRNISNKAPGDMANEDFVTDTSLLFRGYQAGGRMLNVYDWYAAFKEALDGRRRAAQKASTLANGKGKSNLNGKGKQKAADSDDEDDEEEVLGHLTTPSRRGRGRGRGRSRGRGRGGRGVSRGGLGSGRAAGAASGSDAGASRANLPDRNEDEGDGGEQENEHGHDGEQAQAAAGNANRDPSPDSAAESGRESLEGEEREKWDEEVQVRFIRSVHELDLLGFVKHTGRRGEHVVKTVFEPLENH